MTGYTFAIVGREGHMAKGGKHATDRVKARAADAASGMTAEAWADSEDAAREAATAALDKRIADLAAQAERTRRRAAEDPMVRLARLEAFAKERGFDG